METLAYIHLSVAHEEVTLNPDAYEVTLFKGLNWKPPSSAWIGLLSAMMALSIVSLANSAMAAYVRTNGSSLKVRSSPNGAVVGSLRNGTDISLSGRYSGGWAQLSNGNWVSAAWVGGSSGGGTTGGGSPSGLLRFGISGPGVVSVQNRLRDLGYFSGTSTGYYGSVTTSSVRRFQAANGLRVDGVVGPQTRAALY
ncbi:peptidoglycan-binding protein [Trichocoleus sp. FACHB-90]|uniref:peptidoglycan-binding protein n=1 Tax=Cyanophyceae TaxID=3028117 RepID=UPI00168215AE|nr:peptidoglycan-binding protein [Trichocoleus sp. FACHB-90]MBD1929232.1 peptidoglycan-binding protein [Trichocoleus sp. FACHB-90]